MHFSAQMTLNSTVYPVHQCKLLKPSKPNGVYQFPRSLNVVGPPGQSGHVLIMCSREDAVGEGAGSGDQPGAATPTVVTTGGGDAGSGSGSVADDMRVLRLPVSIKSGPPVKVKVRSPKLGVEEFVDEIRATQLAGFKVRRENV